MKALGGLAVGLVLVLVVTTLALPLLVPLLMTGAAGATASPSTSATPADIPSGLLPLYVEAAGRCGMPWPVLAAIGKIESDHGRSNAPGVHTGTNEAGAAGPMQFLAGTWAAYGVDADGDGTADIYSPADAIAGAANYLCANGAADPAELRSAIWHYNHDDAYVDEVLATADRYDQPVP